jgi:hypothetical protein
MTAFHPLTPLQPGRGKDWNGQMRENRVNRRSKRLKSNSSGLKSFMNMIAADHLAKIPLLPRFLCLRLLFRRLLGRANEGIGSNAVPSAVTFPRLFDGQ